MDNNQKPPNPEKPPLFLSKGAQNLLFKKKKRKLAQKRAARALIEAIHQIQKNPDVKEETLNPFNKPRL